MTWRFRLGACPDYRARMRALGVVVDEPGIEIGLQRGDGLQEALRRRRATPAEIARQTQEGGISTVIRPYLETLTANA